MKYIESIEQEKVFAWARNPLVLKKYPYLRWMYANKNTQPFSPAAAGRHKRSGSLAGIPDIFLPLPICTTESYKHGLYIELKIPEIREINLLDKGKIIQKKGVVSSIQKLAISHLQLMGYEVVVCYGATEAIAAIEKYYCSLGG